VSAVLVMATAWSCGGTGNGDAHDRLADAVRAATDAELIRMRGTFGASGPLVQWTAVLTGSEERTTTRIGAILIESRRSDGHLWARRIDQPEPWSEFPADNPLDITALLAGVIDHVEHHDDATWVITLHYDDIDVLAALTHVPSTGPTTAKVTIDDNRLKAVTVDVNGHSTATVTFADFVPRAAANTDEAELRQRPST
jgi:hypothetical protein